MSRIAVFSALALAAASIAISTPADAAMRAGVLSCRGVDSHTFIIGSVAHLACVFEPDFGAPQAYQATIHRFGVDLGFTTSTQVGWFVFAPTNRVGPGELAGSYGGVSASASVGVGVGANALVGGWQNSFALQPLSVQGQTGLNAAAGVANLELVASAAPRPHYTHHRRHHHRRHHH